MILDQTSFQTPPFLLRSLPISLSLSFCLSLTTSKVKMNETETMISDQTSFQTPYFPSSITIESVFHKMIQIQQVKKANKPHKKSNLQTPS